MTDKNEAAKMQTAAQIEADAAARADAAKASRQRAVLADPSAGLAPTGPIDPASGSDENLSQIKADAVTEAGKREPARREPLAPIGGEAGVTQEAISTQPRLRKTLREPLLHTPADVLAYDGASLTAPSLYKKITDWVTVTVPKIFTLHGDDGRAVTYEAGVQEMPAEHAEHWYARANGVQLYDATTSKASAEEKKQAVDEANAALAAENERVRALAAKK